nr:uncharacterized protein LOC109192007 [Ipomoea batatas]
MKDLRLIALCNVLYKIVAKVSENRLKTVLDGLISQAQSAFVPSRLTSNNIMLAYEMHHFLKRKTEGIVALKVDMSKAYDRVEWQFLKGAMLKMGFATKWVDIMLEIVSSVSTMCCMNNDSSDQLSRVKVYDKVTLCLCIYFFLLPRD